MTADLPEAKCTVRGCEVEVPEAHDPCCSSHRHPLCCEHYCRFHFVERNRCSPEQHPARTT